VAIGYPDREEERAIVHRFRTDSPLDDLQPILSTAMIHAANQRCRDIFVQPAIEDYILDLVRTSRATPAIELGVSPRGTMALYRASQALAFVRGRSSVLPDDVKQLAVPVLAHRLILASDARLRGQSAQVVVTKLIESIPIPVEERWSQSQQQ
jgi:MoxR-like ATPase